MPEYAHIYSSKEDPLIPLEEGSSLLINGPNYFSSQEKNILMTLREESGVIVGYDLNSDKPISESMGIPLESLPY